MADPDGSLVSVVVPTYYRNDALPQTIQSVREQTYPRVEIVVVDDSGEANAAPVIEDDDDVEYLALPENRGANGARTAGAERATGRYVHFLDDDDRMYESKLERQMAAMERDDDVGVVYTGIEKLQGEIDRPKSRARGDVLERALRFELWPCMTSTMLIDRDVLDDLLPLADREAANDLEFMIQLAQRTRFDYVDEALLYKQIGDDSSLGYSLAAAEGRFGIVADYRDLYDRFPPSVRERALANAYETKANLLLRQRTWSPDAIRAFVAHYRHAGGGVKPALKLGASLLGRPGMRVVRYVGHRL